MRVFYCLGLAFRHSDIQLFLLFSAYSLFQPSTKAANLMMGVDEGFDSYNLGVVLYPDSHVTIPSPFDHVASGK